MKRNLEARSGVLWIAFPPILPSCIPDVLTRRQRFKTLVTLQDTLPPSPSPVSPQVNPDLKPAQTSWAQKYFGWLDSDYFPNGVEATLAMPKKVEMSRLIPFLFFHMGCLGALWTGWSWTAVAFAVAAYYIRMFAITGFYHRYFSHKTFKTHRWCQFIFALWGMTAAQRGPLWWAAHHRHHHRVSDQPDDVHSLKLRGFWWSHIGWILCSANMPTQYERVKDLAKYPELRFLNRFDWLGGLSYGLFVLAAGVVLESLHLEPGVTAAQIFVWGFFISSVALFHGTCTINSISHKFGNQRYESGDDSKNNFFLNIFSMGEGWHNNHHRFPGTVHQGFYWWEIDVTYWGLKAMSWLGLVWDLVPVPPEAYTDKYRLTKTKKLSMPSTAS